MLHSDILDKCDLADDWHDYAGRCYKYFTDDATWSQAGEICSQSNGNLAILDSSEKEHVFAEIVSCKDFDAGVWIGLSDVVRASIHYTYVIFNGVSLQTHPSINILKNN